MNENDDLTMLLKKVKQENNDLKKEVSRLKKAEVKESKIATVKDKIEKRFQQRMAELSGDLQISNKINEELNMKLSMYEKSRRQQHAIIMEMRGSM